ncbi:MAG TPA: 4Fe-4S dicluster domain-containing protein [Myxococcaceae bacterium]|nr:4Fe-4S dicluster domain-containing protein [Myxococcaceae bacterium]
MPERRHWQSLETPEERGEFRTPLPADADGLVRLRAPGDPGPGPAPAELSRRGFFGMMGLSAAAVTLAGCQRAPVTKLIPYLSKPEEVVPGNALFYASACAGCPAQCGVLLKTRDGRPIKVEGNPDHPWSRGGLCAAGQASVLSLYDASRARGPTLAGRPVTWAALDRGVLLGLQTAAASGAPIYLVAPALTGPTFEATLAEFLSAWPAAKVVRFDSTGELSALAEASEALLGVRALPRFRLDRASTLVSFAADFLGTWIDPVAFARQYADGRRIPLVERREHEEGVGHGESSSAAGRGGSGPDGEERHGSPGPRRRHWQLEPALSLTGSNADRRELLAPSELVPALAGLVRRLARTSDHPARTELARAAGMPEPSIRPGVLDRLAAELRASAPNALVLTGLPDPGAQALALAANLLLGAEGTTFEPAAGARIPVPGVSFETLLAGVEGRRAGAVLFLGCNPVHAHPQGARLGAALREVPLVVATNDRADETGTRAGFLAPDHAPAESWGDASPGAGLTTVRQPALRALFQTRAVVESLQTWSRVPQGRVSAYAAVRERLRAEVFPRAAAAGEGFESFWERTLQAGFVQIAEEPPPVALRPEALAPLLAASPVAPGELELWLHPSLGVGDGRGANNGWLQELPDPLTKVTWDNVAAVAPARARQLGWTDGQLVEVSAGGRSVTVPVAVQPGTHRRVVALALGYGRTGAGTVGNGVGADAFPLAEVSAGRVRFSRPVELRTAAGTRPLARSQVHTSLEGRPLVREATLAEYLNDPSAGNPPEEPLDSAWAPHPVPGPRWGLAVDLSACTGCGACIVGCQAENNVPVVGRDEVLRNREMGWIRIDRYYAGDAENPEVLHQPVMCQHCANAPCETVCPVLATVHSAEGLNQQVYNRCVGTRYCANNCPPKVRRFNWFDYRHDDPVARLVLNPDVVVRSRGVMEKCSLCVHRIQEGKAAAKRQGRTMADGEVATACQQSCPTRAIVLGDLNDPRSKVAALARDARSYRMLAELNVQPGVSYLTRVRNPGGTT